MNLIIFDVDGTLTHTNNVDSLAYAKAIKEYLALEELNTHWEEYKYSTDSGRLIEIFELVKKREPASIEIKAIQNLFFQDLTRLINDSPDLCQPIRGSNSLFKKIQALGDWDVAIATGCWEQSAVFKLDIAKIPHDAIPKATSEDSLMRSEVIKSATNKAKSFYKQPSYNKLVYVGDMPWDYEAAFLLGYNFVGVGSNNEFIKKNVPVIQDYDNDEFFEIIRSI